MGLYADFLAKTKEAVDALQIPFKVKKTRKELEMRIIETEQEIANHDLTVEDQKSKHPINWDKLINAIDDRDLKSRKLKQLHDLEDELFGENKKEELNNK